MLLREVHFTQMKMLLRGTHMATEDQMTVNERRKYLQLMKPRYQQAKRPERSRLLTDMQQVTGLHRKSLLRLLYQIAVCAKILNRKREPIQKRIKPGGRLIQNRHLHI